MQKIYLIIFITILTLQNISAIPDYDPKKRPDTDGPTKVMVRVYFLDIEGINNLKQNYSADVIVRLDWNDERLVNRAGSYSLDKIWHPYLQISNMRDFETRLINSATVLEDGSVSHRQRYYGNFASALDFREFPFDKQILSLNLLSFNYTEDEVEFVLDFGGNEERFSATGWTIVPGEISTEPLKVNLNRGQNESTQMSRAQLTYTMVASRHIAYYWYKVVAPMAIIIFLSWAVFYIDPIQVGAQIGVSATSILTLIAFLLRLENILPPISYLTTMDYFVFAALLLVFLAYTEAVVSTSLALKGRQELAAKFDFWSRFIYPFFFLVIIFYFWVI